MAQKPLKTYTVYRHYDANGVLLYVGQTTDLKRRTEQHRAKAPWREDIARIEAHHFRRKGDAEASERRQIRQLKPQYNRTGTTPENLTGTAKEGWEKASRFIEKEAKLRAKALAEPAQTRIARLIAQRREKLLDKGFTGEPKI